MEFAFVMIGFFVFVTLVFVAVAVFFPEWVGITGKRAKEIQEHQRSDSSSEPKP